MRHHGILVWLLLLLLLLCACGPEPLTWIAHPDQRQSSVVDGRAETGYPTAGYLLKGWARDPGALGPGDCGAILITPDAAVTAAHCVWSRPDAWWYTDTHFGLGLGMIDEQREHPALGVIMHPEYDPYQEPDYAHDLAVLILEDPIADIEPAHLALAQPGCSHRAVGYGWTHFGELDEARTGFGERKSVGQCLDREENGVLFTIGQDGGLCWGDSGSGLFHEDSDELTGVLAHFVTLFDNSGEELAHRCDSGNPMIFTSLWAEREFIECALGRGRDILSRIENTWSTVFQGDPCRPIGSVPSSRPEISGF